MTKLYRVIVPVTDIERAALFYEAVLGSRGTRVSRGRHYFDCEGTTLACFDPRADGDAFDARPNPDHIYLAVDDLQAARERVIAANAVDLGAIATRPWGETSFYFKDPFGNRLCMVDRKTVFTGQFYVGE